MAYQGTIYRVFIASPGDCLEHRSIIRKEIARWNDLNSFERGIVLLPVGWETHSAPEMGQTAQSYINEVLLENCDILIGVFHSRIGQATEKHISGTVEEIKEHVKQNKLAMLYFSTMYASEVNIKQYKEVDKFRKEIEKGTEIKGLYSKYVSTEDFRQQISDHLQIQMLRMSKQMKKKGKRESDILAEIKNTDLALSELTQYKSLVAKNLLLKTIDQDRESRFYKGVIDQLSVKSSNLLKNALREISEENENHFAFKYGCTVLAKKSQTHMFSLMCQIFLSNKMLFNAMQSDKLLSDKQFIAELEEFIAENS